MWKEDSRLRNGFENGSPWLIIENTLSQSMLGKSTHIFPHMLQYASAYALAFSATFPTGTSTGRAQATEIILPLREAKPAMSFINISGLLL